MPPYPGNGRRGDERRTRPDTRSCSVSGDSMQSLGISKYRSLNARLCDFQNMIYVSSALQNKSDGCSVWAVDMDRC